MKKTPMHELDKVVPGVGEWQSLHWSDTVKMRSRLKIPPQSLFTYSIVQFGTKF